MFKWLYRWKDKDYDIKMLVIEDWRKEHKLPKHCHVTGGKIKWKVTAVWVGKYDDETGERSSGRWIVKCEDSNWGDRPGLNFKYEYDSDKKKATCGDPFRVVGKR